VKNFTIKLIIFFSATALLGLIITQTFWVIKAINISQKNFEHRAHSALSSAIDEIKMSLNNNAIQSVSTASSDSAILLLVKPLILDSLLHKYVNFYKLKNYYEFAIAKNSNDSIIYSTSGFKDNFSKETIFKHCLSGVYKKVHYHAELLFPGFQKNLLLNVWGWLTLSVFFLLIIIFCFGFIIFAVFRHKKLSEMKTDFINNMTHEFKTPLSTISLASEILVNANTNTNKDKIHKYAKIIFDENQRMQTRVDQILRMAQLDKGDLEIKKKSIDAHELILNCVKNVSLEYFNKPAKLSYNLNSQNHIIFADPNYFENIVKNLVDNAYKYTLNNPEIEISTSDVNGDIAVSISDNGVGIDKGNLMYIFDKFYRIPTGDVHNVQGSGLGLYYVKKMVEAHSGRIKVTSEPGCGSRFDFFIPVK
jgi:two-component system, OmpR family, phosphate regulon sensor histidine kinase PhoR